MSEIKEAYTTREVATFLGYATVRSVLLRAKQENWPSRPRSGQGGGFEYPTVKFPSRIFLPVNGMSCCHARCLLTPYTILKWQDIRAGRQSSLWLKDTKTAHCRKTSWMQPMLPTPGAALHAGFPLPDFMVGVRYTKQRASLVWFPSIRKRI